VDLDRVRLDEGKGNLALQGGEEVGYRIIKGVSKGADEIAFRKWCQAHSVELIWMQIASCSARVKP